MREYTTYQHWYEINPTRLKMEKVAMANLFPEFNLLRLKDGSLRWAGVLKSDRFSRESGYGVIVEYHECGPDFQGLFDIVMTPTSPDYRALFQGDLNVIESKLLSEVAAQHKCIIYARTDNESGTITTAAYLLRQAIDWFINYENEKARIEQAKSQKPSDATAFRHQEIRETLNPIGSPFIEPTFTKKWYDYYPQLFNIRLEYLKNFFPQFEAKIQRGSLTTICSGNVIILSGDLCLDIENQNGEYLLFHIKITIDEYWMRSDISTSEDNINLITKAFDYTPLPLRAPSFRELPSSLSTLLDAVTTIHEWLQLMQLVLNKTLDRCFLTEETNIPKSNYLGSVKDDQHYEVDNAELNDTKYIYQSLISQKRREFRSLRPYSHEKVKLY